MEQLQVKARAVAAQLEEVGETVLTKKKRRALLASAGPALLVLTFVEDGARIFLRWGEQHHYMTRRMGMGSVTGALALLLSAGVQLGGAALVLRPAHFRPARVKLGSYLLLGFVALQPFMYGQARDVVSLANAAPVAG